MKRSIPELSIDTQTVERLLGTAAVGETVPYRVINEAIGRDVQNGARHVLSSACRRLLRDQHAVFEPVWGQGVKRLDDAGVIGTGVRTLRKIHNAARNGAKKLSAVQDFDALPNDQKVKHNLMAAQFGMLSQVTSDRVAKRLEENTKQSASPLSTAKLLEAMKASL